MVFGQPRSRVAAVVTAMNQGKYLAEALNSLLRQSRPPEEIVYADDGSTDDSLAVARRFPSVRVLALPHQGVAAARNAGYAALTSDRHQVPYVTFLDGDDIHAARNMAIGAGMLDEDFGLGIAYPRMISYEETDGGHVVDVLYDKDFDYHALRCENYITSMSVIRREAFEAAGRWQDVPEGVLWDWWLWLRITRLGWAARKMPDPAMLIYRRHAAQNTRVTKGQRRVIGYQAITRMLPVTVFTPFAHGRPWTLDLWRDNIFRSGLDLANTQAVLADNMDDPALTRQLVNMAAGMGFRAWTVLPVPAKIGHRDLSVRLAGGVTAWMCDLWRRAMPLFDGDLVWSLEDDVRAPEGAFLRLADCLRPDVGIVGSPAVSRWRRPLEVMVYKLAGVQPFSLGVLPNGRMDYQGMAMEGVESVGSMSLCSTLIRRRVLAGHVPIESPNGDGRHAGHEFSLMRRAWQMGLRVLCDWTTPVGHMLDAKTALTVDQWRQDMARPDYGEGRLSLAEISA